MPINSLETYQIGLEIKASDQSKHNIEALKSAFTDTSKSLEDIQAAYQDIIKSSGDHTAEAKAYNSLLRARYGDLERENDLIIHSMSQQGKLERIRLRDLQEKLETTRLTRDEEKELAALKRKVIDLDDEQLQIMQRRNAEARRGVLTAQREARIETTHRKTLAQLVKDDLKAAKDRLKTQLDFIKSLKTTEGRYNALKKAASIGVKGAKAGAKAVAGAAGIVGGIVGGAVSGADAVVEAEKEARRITAPLTPDQKAQLVAQLRISSGKDAASIVDAVNRVTRTLDKKDFNSILSAADAELDYSGMGMLFASSGNTATSEDYGKFRNRLKAIQGATGARIDDLSSVMGIVSNMRDSALQSGVSQQDLVSLYAALKSSEAYDDEEQIERAMRGFLGQSGLNRDNFYDRMQGFDWSRYVDGSQNKNQADTFRNNFDFAALKAANTSEVSAVNEKSAAEKAAETARLVSVKKDELVMKILEKIEPMIADGTLGDVIGALFDVLKSFEPLIKPVLKLTSKILEAIEPIVEKIVELINRFIYAAQNSEGLLDFFSNLANYKSDGQPIPSAGTPTPQSSQGGIAVSPTLVGERGAEAVIPLDYARRGRAGNIIQNVQQTFNMGNNATTALSLGQALKSRSFTANLLAGRGL